MQGLTGKELRDKIASGELKSVAVTEGVFSRIEKYESAVGAFISTLKDYALSRAEEVDRKVRAGEDAGALAGVPIAVKDNICTSFAPTTCASKILENFKAPYNATVIEKLNAAGAVIGVVSEWDILAKEQGRPEPRLGDRDRRKQP